MGEGFSFYAVREDTLDQLPEGIKKFIDDYFVDRNILGVDCCVALDSDYKKPWIDMVEEDYHAGLSQEEIEKGGVFAWFQEHPELVFEYYWS